MPNAKDYPPNICNDLSVTFADGEVLSAAVHTYGTSPAGIYIPASFEGATLTLFVSPDGVTFTAAFDDDGNAVVITVAASTYVRLNAAEFAGINWFKFESDVAVSADRICPLVTRPI
jgi:hypothetical protein